MQLSSRKILVPLVVVIFGISQVEGQLPASVQSEIIKKFLQDTIGIGNITDALRLFTKRLSPSPNQQNISLPCQSAVMEALSRAFFLKDYKELLVYADALGKPGSGILTGNFFMLGSYAECQSLAQAHYCVASADLKIPIFPAAIPTPLGVCAPKVCSGNDIVIMLKTAANAFNQSFISFNNARFHSQYGQDAVCSDEQSYTAGNIAAIIICIILFALCIVGTGVDLFMENAKQGQYEVTASATVVAPEPMMGSTGSNEEVHHHGQSSPTSLLVTERKRQGNVALEMLLCFSFLRNCKSLFNTKLPPGAIGSVNGIRAISMSWVILGHTYFFGFLGGIDNSVLATKIIKRFSFLVVTNAYVSVDSFFLLSGLLVSYLSLRRFHRKGSFPWVQYYVHRYLRLTPVYMFIIFLYIYIFPLLGSGPLWFQHAKSTAIDSCKKKWWANLLYVNNFVDSAEQCIGWTWYLANDMQFYIITPIILLAMFYGKLIGTAVVNWTILLASFIVTIVLIDHYKLNTLLTTSFESVAGMANAGEFFDKVYEKPYCRIAPYIVGIVLGYMLFKDGKPRGRSVARLFYSCGWILAIIVSLLIIWGPWGSIKEGGKPFSDAENIVYGTFMRFAWACCIAFVIYACHNGYGGMINRFLSWPAFIPLSRLTYCAYLIHPIIMEFYFGTLHAPYHFTDISVVFLFFGFLSMAYTMAFVVSVIVEYPLMSIEKLLIKG